MRGVQDGEEASAKEGCQWSLGLSTDGGCAGRMWSRRQMIAVYMATRPIFKACMEGKRRRGLMPRQWWWEQPMCLDAIHATGSDGNHGQLDAPAPADA